MLREWEKDTGYSFDRNPNYFKTGRPFFEGLKIYLIVDVARNLSALQTGQVYGTYQAEARELLAAAGYPDGFDITLNVVNTAPALPGAEVTAPQMRNDLNIDINIQPTDLATMYVGMRDGVANMSSVGTGIILRDPGDIINQFYLQDVLRDPHNWQNDRVDELIALQNEAIDPAARQGNLEEMADILHRGESHWVPYFWFSTAGAYDYRIRNFYYPPTLQLVKKWDHVWFDEDREMPDGVGYVP